MALDPKQVLFSSDAPIDRVIGTISGSLAIPYDPNLGGYAEAIIPHNFGFAPLFHARWSDSPSFDFSHECTWVTPVYAKFTPSVATSSTDIKITAGNNSGAAGTMYYQIFFFLPPNVSPGQLPTPPEQLVMSSDYNYTKLVQQGTLGSSGGTITHNLGYLPQVEAWVTRFDGRIQKIDYSTPANFSGMGGAEVEVTTSQVIFYPSSSPPQGALFYYKIYSDGF